MWRAYIAAPWTRDGTVRVYVVTLAPEVAGRIVELPVADNQFVHKGDLLMVIDPTNYKIAVSLAEAAADQASATAKSAQAQSERRQEADHPVGLGGGAADFREQCAERQCGHISWPWPISTRRGQTSNAHASVAGQWLGNQLADAARRLRQRRARTKSPWSKPNSFWVDGYFEETNLEPIREGDPAAIKLMGYSQIVRGHVDSIARGINVANAQPDASGLASVNPIFTWVRWLSASRCASTSIRCRTACACQPA